MRHFALLALILVGCAGVPVPAPPAEDTSWLDHLLPTAEQSTPAFPPAAPWAAHIPDPAATGVPAGSTGVIAPTRSLAPEVDLGPPNGSTMQPSHLQSRLAPPVEDSLALASGVEADIPLGWTGAIIYTQDDCPPCEAEIEAVRASAGWTVGKGALGFRGKSHFVVIRLKTGEDFDSRGISGTPVTVYFRDGKEIPGTRIKGYYPAWLNEILSRNPLAKKPSTGQRRSEDEQYDNPLYGDAYQGSFAANACRCMYGEPCICAPGTCTCLNCPCRVRYSMGPAFAVGGGYGCGAPVVSSGFGAPLFYSAPVYSAPVYAATRYSAGIGFGVGIGGVGFGARFGGSCGPGGCR